MFAIALHGHVHATLAGQSVDKDFSQSLPFTLQPLELQPGVAGTSGSAQSSSGPNKKQTGSVTATSTVPNPLHVLGHTVSGDALTGIGLAGFVLCGLLAVPLMILLQRNRAFDEAARIRSRYSHLLVPILIGEDLGWPPVDVTSFRALVRLAEASGQMILHHQADAVDTYLVNDNGTVYRYQIRLPEVTWGDWTESNVAADPAQLSDAATALAQAAAAPANEAAPTQS